MIKIQKSETADTRTCDINTVTKDQLKRASLQHIGDVVQALSFFTSKLIKAAGEHDYDKLTEIDHFYRDFKSGFKEREWWNNHRKMHRHHLNYEDGVPDNVNLVDVLEYISDCVMAGMARSGYVYEIKLSDDLLQKAFQNTVTLLKNEVVVEGNQ